MLSKKGEVEKLKKKKRKILKKLFGPEKENKIRGGRKQKYILYWQIKNNSYTIRKRRLKFVGPSTRMNESRQTNKIFSFIIKIKTATKWVEETRKETLKVGIYPTESWNKEEIRIKVEKSQEFQGKGHEHLVRGKLEEHQSKNYATLDGEK